MGVKGWEKEAGEGDGRIRAILGARSGVGGKTEGNGWGGQQAEGSGGTNRHTDGHMDTHRARATCDGRREGQRDGENGWRR